VAVWLSSFGDRGGLATSSSQIQPLKMHCLK
jgi:hypothetical protein